MNPPFCDAHLHLQDDRFGGRQAELLATALSVGVRRWVVNGTSERDWAAVARTTELYPGIIPSFGYHPWYLRERTAGWREELVRRLDRTPGAVLGEIGLDGWILRRPAATRGDDPPESANPRPAGMPEQIEIFESQWGLASERGLPVSVHCLQAWEPLLTCLRRWPRLPRGFLLHSYGGPGELVPELVRHGAYFGFPGYFLTARKSRQREVFRGIPGDRLLVETDAPDQPLPEPLNSFPLTEPATGRALNHPANLPAIYTGLADLLGQSVSELSGRVAANFSRLFDREEKSKTELALVRPADLFAP